MAATEWTDAWPLRLALLGAREPRFASLCPRPGVGLRSPAFSSRCGFAAQGGQDPGDAAGGAAPQPRQNLTRSPWRLWRGSVPSAVRVRSPARCPGGAGGGAPDLGRVRSRSHPRRDLLYSRQDHPQPPGLPLTQSVLPSPDTYEAPTVCSMLSGAGGRGCNRQGTREGTREPSLPVGGSGARADDGRP